MQVGALPPVMCRIVQELQSDLGERIMWMSMSRDGTPSCPQPGHGTGKLTKYFVP